MTHHSLQFLSAYYLLILPIVWVYLIGWYQSEKSAQASIADIDSMLHSHFYHPFANQLIKQFQQQSIDKPQRYWKKPLFWWQGIALSSLIVALAEPVLIGERLPDPPAERDIVFLVDTSLSMQLEDYFLDDKPIKRMDLLRKLLDEFTIKMKGEYISVIIFAEHPYTLVPLSNDQYLIRSMLGRITTTLAGRYTAVGDALLMALKEASKQGDRHQTFILFTDADESRGNVDPVAAAKLVAERKIPIFTIAIGSSQKDSDQKIKGGLYQSVNFPLLKEIASVTNGAAYQVEDSHAIEEALNAILSQRQNKATVEPQYEHQVFYFYPLFFGLFIIVMIQLMRLKKVIYAR